MKKTGTSICNHENGKLQPHYNMEMFLDAVETLNYPSKKTISEHLGCSHGTTLLYLDKLMSDDWIDRAMIGNTWIYRVKG